MIRAPSRAAVEAKVINDAQLAKETRAARGARPPAGLRLGVAEFFKVDESIGC
jgi:hypothetical protein